MDAEVTRRGFLYMQICVPVDWTDGQVLRFAETENPAGTERGWEIRRESRRVLAGPSDRVPCNDRADHVHIMLDV